MIFRIADTSCSLHKRTFRVREGHKLVTYTDENMPKNKLSKKEKQTFLQLGKKLRALILEDLGYESLDRFALEHHDIISKPTLYAICDGERDFQFSTLLRLAEALETSVPGLLKDI